MKEFLVVILLGTGALFVVWGLFQQINISYTLVPHMVRHVVWKSVWLGICIIAISIAIGIFVKPRKNIS
jgi:ABC-type Fe3+ transport system permease subunit